MADAIVENLFLVNAPAGSGKTTWIRKNVRKYLLQNPTDNVLCQNFLKCGAILILHYQNSMPFIIFIARCLIRLRIKLV